MNIGLIKDYLSSPIEVPSDVVERELIVKEISHRAVAIIGPRRAGKSTYMRVHAKNKLHSLFIDFDDLVFSGVSVEDVYVIIKKIAPEVKEYSPKYVFLDEVQSLRNWHRLVRTLLDLNYRVWISGSSSKLLSRELATQLRGRTIQYLLLPFSFVEFLKLKKVMGSLLERHGKILALAKEYLRWGGFPEVIRAEVKRQLLNQYRQEIILKDLMERHNFTNFILGEQLALHLFQNYAKEVTIRSLAKKLGHSPSLMKQYMDGFLDTLSFFLLPKFSFKAHVRAGWPRKLYLADVGLAVDTVSESFGQRMENVVFLKLYSEFFNSFAYELFYFSSSYGEVDFVVKHGPKVEELIQVTYASEKDEIPRRELKALLKAADLLKSKHLTVITWDYAEEEKIDGKMIRYVPLWKWLLD